MATTNTNSNTNTNPNPTINISSQNVYGNCDLKCSYNFQYNQSNSVATNNGVFISLSYDKGSTNQVMYNNQSYYVTKIYLFSPSLHIFNGNSANAELLIEHMPEMGGELLHVCIPIISSSNSSDASNILNEIIQSISNNAPSINETTNLNLSDFNLNNIVPNKPFFAYTGIEGLSGQVIVFGITNAIPLSEQILTTLSNIIKPYPITVSGGNLFFNSKGPNQTQISGDGIYISCQPTGSSEEETNVTYNNSYNTNYNLGSILKNPTFIIIFQVIIGCIVFVIVFMLLNYGYNYFISSSPKLPKLPKMPTMPTMPKMSLFKSLIK
jgi:carbonic anhydrase